MPEWLTDSKFIIGLILLVLGYFFKRIMDSWLDYRAKNQAERKKWAAEPFGKEILQKLSEHLPAEYRYAPMGSKLRIWQSCDTAVKFDIPHGQTKHLEALQSTGYITNLDTAAFSFSSTDNIFRYIHVWKA